MTAVKKGSSSQDSFFGAPAKAAAPEHVGTTWDHPAHPDHGVEPTSGGVPGTGTPLSPELDAARNTAFGHWFDGFGMHPGKGVQHVGPGGADGGAETAAPAPAATAAPAPAAAVLPPAPAQAEDPASRNTDISEVKKSAHDEKTRQKLDTDWIKELPPFVRDSIDGPRYSDGAAAAKLKKETGGKVHAVDADIDKQEKALKAATIDRLTDRSDPKHPKKPKDADVTADSDYKTARDELEAQRQQRKKDLVAEQQAADDASVAVNDDRRKQSVARTDEKDFQRQEGQALARTNFMSWAVHVLGSTERAKAHFQSIEKVEGTGNTDMYLEHSTRVRFEVARAAFEKEHPGYTMPSTDEALSLRDMHEARWGVGMLGHALGVAMDFAAADNPNVKIGDKQSYDYLLDKFGGTGERGTGRARMDLRNRDPEHPDKKTQTDSDPIIEQLGKDTIAGKTSAAGDAMVDRIRGQFREMKQTSDNFQASMAPHLGDLKDARDLYFRKDELKKQLAANTARNKHLDKAAELELKKELAAEEDNRKKAGDPNPKVTLSDADKQQRIEEIKTRFLGEVADQQKRLDATDPEVKRLMGSSFATWDQGIQHDVDNDEAKKKQNDLTAQGYSKEEVLLRAAPTKGSDANKSLTELAEQFGLTTADQMDKKHKPKDAAAYQAMLVKQLEDKITELQGKNKGLDADEKALKQWQDRLKDPKFVFGARDTRPIDKAGHIDSPDGHTRTLYEASSVPLMQLIENGFVRNDAMPDRDPKDGKKVVYNEEVVATLAKYGFSPGASYGDTMHFDFIEGYTNAVPGGRKQENMDPHRYSPEGDYVEPVTAHAEQKKK